jgi:hypothetical protein
MCLSGSGCVLILGNLFPKYYHTIRNYGFSKGST